MSGTNLGDRLQLRIYLPQEMADGSVKRVVMTFPGNGSTEYLVGFRRQKEAYYSGDVYVDPLLLERRSLEWIQENVGISIGSLPARVACTGSMRPVIDCGDQVHYEAVLPETPLQVGDIVTFRFSDLDVDIQRDCPYISNLSGITSVSSLTGTQSIYIIHRIVRKVFGSYPDAFITRGDNNFSEDHCRVKKPSIVLKVVEVVKNVYVLNQDEYDRAAAVHQQLLVEYGTGIADYIDLIERYNAMRRDYNIAAGTGLPQVTLDAMYQSLLQTNSEIELLADRLNQIPAQTYAAQLGMERYVAPYSVQLP